jgi:hypothetical protein
MGPKDGPNTKIDCLTDLPPKYKLDLRLRKGLSTMSLQVVKGDKKGTHCSGLQLGHPSPVGYKYGTWPLIGGISNERVRQR